MNKLEVQKRVLKNGKKLDLDKFCWDEKTNTFSSDDDNIVVDFYGINECTFKTGSYCTFKNGSYCTFYTGSSCTFDTSYECTFDTSYECTFKTGDSCTFKTGSSCTFDTSYECTFKTGSYCTFKTGASCTFDTSSYCTFDTSYECTFKTGELSIIIYRKKGKLYKLETDTNKTYQTTLLEDNHSFLVDGISIEDSKRYIIADGILSQVINKKGNVYKVINYGEEETSFIIKQGDIYSHGKTIKDAKESLIYKISDRDTSKYDYLTVTSILTKEEAIQCYRCITGACELGTRIFVESIDNAAAEISVNDLIILTENKYGNDIFKDFFNVEREII